MDKLQWFKFSYADWRMGRIQRCPETTQARFINLCCLYWSKEGDLSYEDAEIEIDEEHLKILINKKVILINNNLVSIKFLDEQLEEIAENSKGKSRAAKARWDKYKTKKINAGAMHVHTDAMQNDAEKRREEEIREEKTREDNNAIRSIKEIVIDYKKNERLINALLTSKEKLFSNKKEINDKLDEFVESLKLQDVTTKKELDFKKHFLNWVNVKKKAQQSNQSTSTLKQTPIER